jgi:hypothetical protein
MIMSDGLLGQSESASCHDTESKTQQHFQAMASSIFAAQRSTSANADVALLISRLMLPELFFPSLFRSMGTVRESASR